MAITEPQVCSGAGFGSWRPGGAPGSQTLPNIYGPGVDLTPSAPQGWECPKCGHCYAPCVPMCHFCPVPEQPAFIGKASDDG